MTPGDGTRPDGAAGPAASRQLDAVLRAVATGTAAATGEAFFRDLVEHLARALGVYASFVAEFSGVGTTVKTLAAWYGDGFRDNFELDTSHTPCRVVYTGELVYYPEGVATLYPGDPGLAKRGIESYLGVPLCGADGEVLGHLVIMDTKPFGVDAETRSLLDLFAARAAAELARKRAVDTLQGILASAKDAIVAVDPHGKVVLFNQAAEQMFGAARASVTGRSLDDYLSEPFQNTLRGISSDIDSRTDSVEPLWAPLGMAVVRADGTTVPVDATVSPSEVGGRTFLTLILRDIRERRRAEAALARLEIERSLLRERLGERDGAGVMVGGSDGMRHVIALIAQVAPTDATVLISGETGTGKELVADAIHTASARSDAIAVKLNCAALPRELIESELFGHEKGAFTGALQRKKGRFELAHGGTLFLDEVGELSLEAQAKLLRVLQEREVERVGGTQPIPIDVRLVAATNRDLAPMIAAGAFRADLFYRLNVFPISVPALRERRGDIGALADLFLQRFTKAFAKPLEGIEPRALARLQNYAWPGNVRELQNVIERATILSPGPLLVVDDTLGRAPDQSAAAGAETLESVERAHIEQVLMRTGGVIEGPEGAATILGINPNTLRSRMKRLGVTRKPAS